jgi:hypothetical protein
MEINFLSYNEKCFSSVTSVFSVVKSAFLPIRC